MRQTDHEPETFIESLWKQSMKERTTIKHSVKRDEYLKKTQQQLIYKQNLKCVLWPRNYMPLR